MRRVMLIISMVFWLRTALLWSISFHGQTEAALHCVCLAVVRSFGRRRRCFHLDCSQKQTEQRRRRGSPAVSSFECKESKASNGKVFSTAVVRSSNSRHFLSVAAAVFGRQSALGAAFDDDAIEPVDTCVC